MRRTTAIAVFATLVGMVFGLGSVSADSTRPTLKNYQHVFVIMMENTGYDALIGNPNAPWINDAAGRYGLATNYTGVIHPSQPNYIASTAGITGADTDNDETLDVPNLVDQLESHSKTWKSYSQSFSLCNGNVLAHSCGNQLSERKHNPFVSFTDVRFGDTSGCCDAVPGHGGGRVVSLVISHSDHTARTSALAYNHYSLLRTIQDGWQLGCLGFACDTASVPAMSDLTGPRG